MKRRFLPLAAAFSMMAAAADEQQAVGARESEPHPNGERLRPAEADPTALARTDDGVISRPSERQPGGRQDLGDAQAEAA